MARFLSFFAATLGLVLLSPLMLAIAIGIRTSMGRPVFFHQLRAGLNQKPFKMIKFRSMISERSSDGNLLPDAQRVSPLGRFLRRTRVDELPELVNILRNDMAWIGPRPLLPETITEMGAAGTERCLVRPGLTGWAQVNGNTLLSREQKISLDLWYVKNQSLWLNITILLFTAYVVLGGERVNHTALEKCRASNTRRSS